MNDRTRTIIERAREVLARGDALLAQPRDPEVVARAAAWERGYRERNPMPDHSSRNTTGADAMAVQRRTVEYPPRQAPQRRAAPAGVSMTVLQSLATEIGQTIGRMEKRLQAAEERNGSLLARIADLEAQLAGRLVTPVPKMLEGRRYDA